MGAAERVNTSKETLDLIRAKAAEQDVFAVKVLRRKHMSMAPELVSSLNGATLANFVNPELWLPQLCGGGKLHLQAFHVSDPNKPVGGVVEVPIENLDSKEVDLNAPSRSGWQGPAEVTFPLKSERRPNEDMGYGGVTSIHAPPGPGASDSASRNSHGWSRSPGGGSVERPDYGNGAGQWERPQALAAIESERRKLEEEKLSAERERAKVDREAMQRAHDAEIRSLRSEFTAKIDGARNTGPDPMVEMLKQQAEDRREMAKQAAEDRRAADAQRAEDRRLAQAAQDRADERMMKLLEKIGERPKEDLLGTAAKLIELTGGGKKGNDGIIEAQTKMMHSMSELMSSQIGTAMDFVSAAADLQLGAQGGNEPGWVKGLESVVKTVGAMAKGVQVRRPPIAPPAPPERQALPYEQQAQQPPAPQPAPVQQQAKPKQPAGPPPPVLDQFIAAIKRGNSGIEIPVATIAQALRENLMDPTLIQAFAESNNDFELLLGKHLNNWANENPGNRLYLDKLIAEVKKQFTEHGIIDSDAPTAPGAAEPEAEGEEEEGEYEEVGEEEGDETEE